MPALEALSMAPALTARSANSTNATLPSPTSFEVICAWPVSGQYGPGSRILYYVLVAICVLARRAEWLRNACLAAALLLPLVASLHGIVLASVHTDRAVDLDIYGAFQLCAIGVLVAPVAATLSRTYFKNPGRNAIVLWSLLVVAGLISLTVEFYRVSNQHTICVQYDNGTAFAPNDPFPYEQVKCGLTCSPEAGPKSTIRGGSADNIYVIPVPYVLTFNVCIMLTAACCIPAILLVVWMMVTSSHTNWTRRFGEQSSLTLKAPVKLFSAEQGMPSLDELRRQNPSLSRIGVVGTQSYSTRRASGAVSPRHAGEEAQAEHHEVALDSGEVSSNAAQDRAGITSMLHDLHHKSALSVYDFELHGKPLQLREMKLASNVENFARQIYNALRDLENEDVEMICVESIEAEEGSPEENVMKWLQNEENASEQDANRAAKSTGGKRGGPESRTPGATIILGFFSVAVLAILVVGERNLFSGPVNYQTEPMANVGQWSPVAGTILVVSGSIYVLIAEAMRKERRRMRASGDSLNSSSSSGPLDRLTRRFVRRLIKLNDFFDAPRWLFDHTEFQRAQRKFPNIPGEKIRNPDLDRTIESYEPQRESGESMRSRATSRSRRSTASRPPGPEQNSPRDGSPSDPPQTPAPTRKRTLTLPEVDAPSRPARRSTQQDSPPVTPMEPIVPHNPLHPTITISSGDDEGGRDTGEVIR